MARSDQIGRFAAMAAALLLAVPVPGHAQPSELVVKAAFLPKFARYVTWPEGARPAGVDPISLCIVGRDRFGALIDRAVRGQSVDQRPIVVRRLTSARDAAGCQLAFVNGGSTDATSAILEELKERPVLTITDARFGAARGMIHFAVEAGRVRFYIDQAMAERAQLKLDSRLLNIALGVRQRPS